MDFPRYEARTITVKQIAQYQDGRLDFQEVPRPTPPPGGVLVRTTHSVISVGTEKMKVEQARMNLLQKAKARPDQVRKVLDTARNLGWRNALEKVRNRLETPTPLGYSAAGIVEEVHSANTRFKVGDLVACGGADIAFHAEYLAMPDLLTAKVPAGVDGWQAAYTTICSIALQAVRQTDPKIGDKVLVLGQGLVGLLVANFLTVAGASVMAVDLLDSRKSFSEAMGADQFVNPRTQNLAEAVRFWTDGFGVDAVVVCTASQSNTPIEQAADALRDRGRLVDVGITKMELPWKVFYEKELDVRFSRSYGPGRYDPVYEHAGVDYPIGYVRWTEQRNFQACLELMAKGRLALEAITTKRTAFANAPDVYNDLTKPDSSDIGVVLEYGGAAAEMDTTSRTAAMSGHESGSTEATGRLAKPVTTLNVIGAGNFARTMLLPHLKDQIRFGAIVNQTSLSANHVRSKFGFESAATDYNPVLEGAESNAVIIATRHHLHAPILNAALAGGHHVFVEKPLCLTLAELEEIDQSVAKSTGSVQVGFNRRFAPASRELKRELANVPGPKSASIRVMAGKLDPHHWYANYDESGGRVLGEACHFFDFFCFLFDSVPVRVFAQTVWPSAGLLPFPDSVSAQIEFADGSTGQLIYSGEGDTSYPKETLTVFGAGLSAEIINFQKLHLHQKRQRRASNHMSKGHAEQMSAWASYLKGESAHPLPYVESRRSMLLTFAALESIQKGTSVKLS